MSIAARVHDLQQIIRKCEAFYQRAPDSVQLLAVSKGHTSDEICEAIDAGLLDFGESYYQEALLKINALTAYPLCWHFIGPIQRNKTPGIATHFSWVHSLCRLDIAERLNHARPASAPPLQVCIQININEEPTKSGLYPHEVDDFARAILTFPHLKLRGLMVIPQPEPDANKRYATFQCVAQMLKHLNQTLPIHLDTLSMGMSDDLNDAIHAGSTMVRIGRKLFGERAK